MRKVWKALSSVNSGPSLLTELMLPNSDLYTLLAMKANQKKAIKETTLSFLKVKKMTGFFS